VTRPEILTDEEVSVLPVEGHAVFTLFSHLQPEINFEISPNFNYLQQLIL
jgi:hypothetical protein